MGGESDTTSSLEGEAEKMETGLKRNLKTIATAHYIAEYIFFLHMAEFLRQFRKKWGSV